MSIKDMMGNTLEPGDWVSFIPRTDGPTVGRVVAVEEGGLSLIAKGAMTPTKLMVQVSFTFTVDHRINAFPILARIVHPQSEEIVKKILEGGETPPGSDTKKGPSLVS